MSLKDDEKWVAVAPFDATMWQVTIRNKDGSYREPMTDEVFELLGNVDTVRELRSALSDALGLLRAYVTVYGSDADIDAQIRTLMEHLK